LVSRSRNGFGMETPLATYVPQERTVFRGAQRLFYGERCVTDTGPMSLTDLTRKDHDKDESIPEKPPGSLGS